MELDTGKLTSLEFIPAKLRTLFINKGYQLVMLVLVVLLAFYLAEFGWKMYEMFALDSAKQQSQVVLKPSKRSTAADMRKPVNLSSLHLFGQEDFKQSAVKAPVTAPETRLSLILYGVFSDADVKKGSAIIGARSGKQKQYLVGEKVATGVWLAEVRADHVLLRRGSGYEVLKFPKKKTRSVNLTRVKTNQQRPVAGISKKKQAFMDNVRVVPVFAGKGKGLKGYRILPKRNRALYNKLGLRPSDIVTSINGISLSDERESMKVIAELAKADQVEVVLDRRGQTKTMTLNLK